MQFFCLFFFSNEKEYKIEIQISGLASPAFLIFQQKKKRKKKLFCVSTNLTETLAKVLEKKV